MRTLLIIILALAIALTACRRNRDDGDDPTPAPTPAATATAAPTPTTTTPALTPTPAPAQPTIPAAEPGATTGSMTFDGIERTWRLYVPNSLPADERVPLVVGLHGGLGSGEQFARNSGFDDEAEAGAFIAVYPDGVGATWNGGRCCGLAAATDVDDVGFIAALIDQVEADYPVDPARVYATGHSNGAIMSFRLACELSGRIAAIAVVAGSLETGDCSPSRPVSVLLIHGDADLNHPLEGGQGPNSIANVDFTSVADTMETIRAAMSCEAATTSAEDGGVTTTTWSACPSGADVQLKVIAGASHAWPGSTGISISGPPSQLLDATSTIWSFLGPHRAD